MKNMNLPAQVAIAMSMDSADAIILSRIEELVFKISKLTQIGTEGTEDALKDLINTSHFMRGWTIDNLQNVFDLLSMSIPIDKAIEIAKKGIIAHQIHPEIR